jgi:hypothetical protein
MMWLLLPVQLGHIVNNEVGKFVGVAFFVSIRYLPVKAGFRRLGTAGS